MSTKEINKAVPRPAIRYLGSKWLLAPWIIEHMPDHSTYVEPFGGAAAVLLRKHPARHEVYNDLDREIFGFFKVLQSSVQCRQLIRLLKRTPWSRDQYREAFTPTDDPVIRAQRAVIRAYMGIHHSALFDLGKAGGFATSNGGEVRSWHTYPRTLARIHQRLKQVVLENRDAFRLFDTHDAPDTLFFVDPPYLPKTRNKTTKYRCDFTEAQHIALLQRLNTLQGVAMVAGYPSELYDDMLSRWQRLERIHYARSNGIRKATEVLWINRP
jgi:DNA adenine methylase